MNLRDVEGLSRWHNHLSEFKLILYHKCREENACMQLIHGENYWTCHGKSNDFLRGLVVLSRSIHHICQCRIYTLYVSLPYFRSFLCRSGAGIFLLCNVECLRFILSIVYLYFYCHIYILINLNLNVFSSNLSFSR